VTDVKRLLEQATPLPWRMREYDHDIVAGPDGEDEQYVAVDREGLVECVRHREDSELILYAVNHLPDYEAAVDALDRIVAKLDQWEVECRSHGVWRESDPDARMANWVRDEARAALRRLRGDR
jgi:hypothetical protein